MQETGSTVLWKAVEKNLSEWKIHRHYAYLAVCYFVFQIFYFANVMTMCFINILSLIYKRNVCLFILRNYDSLCACRFNDANANSAFFFFSVLPFTYFVLTFLRSETVCTSLRFALRNILSVKRIRILSWGANWNGITNENALFLAGIRQGTVSRFVCFVLNPSSDSLFARSSRIKSQLTHSFCNISRLNDVESI